MKKGSNGEKVNWLKVKWIRVTKSNWKSIFVNYGFDESRYIEILASDKSTSGRPQTIANVLYGTKLCISAEKKKDLVSLCTSGIIPSEFHQYYKSLPSNKKTRDVLPDSDIEDDDNVDTDGE
jgi:hypothetical protein